MAAAVLVAGAAVPANANGGVSTSTSSSHASPDLEEGFDRIGVAQEDRAVLVAKLDAAALLTGRPESDFEGDVAPVLDADDLTIARDAREHRAELADAE